MPGGLTTTELGWSQVKSNQFKILSAGLGASAFVAMGALTIGLSATPSNPGVIGEGPELTLGETTTETTAPAEPMTSFASPTAPADVVDGFEPQGDWEGGSGP